jgi:predicted lysophospholipase L1 biosynthesis ABC-type transport system permease subunit
MKSRLYWTYATRSLVRGGQRTILAIFCVAVGVMAIVALQLVGLSVDQALLGNIVVANGGDLRVNASIAPLRQHDLAFFDQLQQKNLITDYATVYDAGGSVVLPSGSEETFSLLAVSHNFPLLGQPDFIAPSTSFHNLTLQQVVSGNRVAVSAHVFQVLGVHIGDTYRVKTLDGRIVPVVVAAEFQEEGAFRAPQMIIAQETLDAVPGPDALLRPVQYDTIYITTPAAHLQQVKMQISRTFPSVRVITAQDLLQQRQQQVQQIQLFLHIVGLLALFIGGIGIVNTMQVLLRRRQLEIAMLKTSGYRRVDLYGLFGLEAALLGIVGGGIGALAGIGASYLVTSVVEYAFSLQLPVVLDVGTVLSGLGVGIATALIFGVLPIVQASQVRPLTVLRESGESAGITSRLTIVLLLLLLSFLFVGLAATIIGDVITALIIVYGGAAAILILALVLGLLVLAISHLPVYERPGPRLLLRTFASAGSVVAAGLLFLLLSVLGQTARAVATHLGNPTIGIYLLAVLGGAGILLLGCAFVFFLATLVNCLVMFAPRTWKTPVMLAYRNLGRQWVRTATTLTALFVGIFAIGLVLILGQGIKDTINSTLSTLFTRNVFVVVPPKQKDAVTTQLPHLKGLDRTETVVSPVVSRLYPLFIGRQDLNTVLRHLGNTGRLRKEDVIGSLSTMQGFDLAQGGSNIPTIVLKKGRNLDVSDAGSHNVVVSGKLQATPVNLQVGDTIVVQSADGTVTMPFTIVGFYDDTDPTGNPNFAAMLTDEKVATQLGGSLTLEVFSLKVDPDQLPAFKQQLNKAVPSAFIISIVDVDAIVNQVLDKIVVMLTTIASLAMIAGLIIIANAVALAMLERQREIGILKAVGYTSRTIIATVLLENGLIGLLGALVAMSLAVGAITLLGQFVFHVSLSIDPLLIGVVIIAASLVTMAVAVLVAWNAARMRPLEVLRYE